MKKIINTIYTPKIMSKLSAEAKSSLINLFWVSLIMTLASAAIFGFAAMAALNASFIAVFLGMAVMIGMLNQYLIKPSTEGKSKLWIRASIGVLLSFLVATCLDIVIYNDSISEFWKTENEIAKVEIDSLYEQKEIAINERINELATKNDSLNDQMNDWASRIYQEVNSGTSGLRQSGYGKVAKRFSDLMTADSARIAPLLKSNQLAIESLQTDIDSLHAEKDRKIGQLTDPKSRSVLDKLTGLHTLIFENGNYMVIAVYLAWFLFALILELLPLKMKLSCREYFVAYLTEAKREAERKERDSRYQDAVEEETARELARHQEQLNLALEKKKQQLIFDETIEAIESEHELEKQNRKVDKQNIQREISRRILPTSEKLFPNGQTSVE